MFEQCIYILGALTFSAAAASALFRTVDKLEGRV